MPVTLVRQSTRWKGMAAAQFRTPIQQLFSYLSIEDSRDMAVVLSDDRRVQVLNHEFRGKDKPTNVLSFPSDEPDEWGDIVLAHETIAREAEAQNKLFWHHVAHLLVHGTLHLLGYDHIDDQEAEEMEQMEIAILSQLSIANPYKNG